jgi:hypothetical protein
MRTKESEEFQEQENTWIYLLHQQAPPQTRETSAAALAQAAGAPPTLPPATSLFGGSSALFPSRDGGPYASRLQFRPGGFPSSSSGPYMFKTPQESGVYGMKQQQTMIGSASGRMMRFAHEKLQDAWGGSDAVVSRESVAFPFPPSSINLEDTYRRKQHHYPAAELNGASAALEKYQQLDATTSDVAPSSLLELLPNKRRRSEEAKVNASAAFEDAEAATRDDDESDAGEFGSASTPRSSSRGKRNCFPKKCDFPMCKNSSRSRGFCYSHGGGRRCRMDGCSNGAVSRDLCKRHGGGRRCKVAGCKSSSESGGLCYSHGGGRRCSLAWCTARAKKGGFCALHLVDQNAERPPSSAKSDSSSRSAGSSASGAEEDAASGPTASSSSSSPRSQEGKEGSSAGHEAVVHANNAVETLLALARDQQAAPLASEPEATPTTGYAIASILN